MTRAILTVFVVSLTIGGTLSCVSPQKIAFNKGKILDPMMDPAKTGGFHSAFRGEPLKGIEHGAAGGSGSVGGSCPTCGG